MAKAGLIVLAFLAIWGGPGIQRGCQNATTSLTHLTYWPKRDMRSTVFRAPQRVQPMSPDSMSVPIGGRERWDAANEQAERDRLDRSFTLPVVADSASIRRGEAQFQRTCVPCHGATLKGDGPVIAKYIPPPDLLGPTTRARSDGFIYGYIRHGGAVMPSYAAQVSAQETYELIHYIRHLQGTQPR